ncbi:MAG: 50S ribosomal protein L13 [Spirochaetes bacterium]|nr:50S ribosomal protein L13 [Spirochaetota bacterium]
MNITKRAKNVEHKWYLIDAKDQVLGRLSTKIADILSGKNKEYYSPDTICGDYVIVINVDKIRLTGNKLETKLYRWHSGHPGGLKEKKAGEMLKKNPRYMMLQSVKGMLPRNKLRDKLIRYLKVYSGEEHEHKAQKPIKVEMKG